MLSWLSTWSWIQWILFSLNSVLFPLAPVLHLSPGRESCIIPSSLCFYWVTGTGTSRVSLGWTRAWLFQELPLCPPAAHGLFIHGLLSWSKAWQCLWVHWGSQHCFALLIPSPCSYRQTLILLKLCLGGLGELGELQGGMAFVLLK